MSDLRQAAFWLVTATNVLDRWDRQHGYVVNSERDGLASNVDGAWDALRIALAAPGMLGTSAVAYIRERVAAEPTLAWPGEIDDILDDAHALAADPALIPEGWYWECLSCDQPVVPMGMCATCGVFGVMRIGLSEAATPCPHPDSWFDRSLCPIDDWMHTRCSECGVALDGVCSEEGDQG